MDHDLVAIPTGQGDICELLVSSELFKAWQSVFLKIIPIQAKFLSAHRRFKFVGDVFDDDIDDEVLKVFDDYVYDDDDIDISRAFDPLLYENGWSAP